MISADDLRKEYTNVLYASSVAAELAKLDPILRAAAARGERSVAFRGFGFGSINPYTQKFDTAQTLMVERLSDLGVCGRAQVRGASVGGRLAGNQLVT